MIKNQKKNKIELTEKRQINEICYLIGGPQMLLRKNFKDLARR